MHDFNKASAGTKFKVQVGVRTKASSERDTDRNETVNKTTETVLDPMASNFTLYSLCDKDFSKNNGKRKAHMGDYGKSSSKSTRKEQSSSRQTQETSLKKDVGPQVEIINGKIVLKESSLLIGGTESAVPEGDYEEVEEEVHAMSKYSSYLDRRRSSAWGIEETRLFYSALRQVGTEFSLMQTFFPSRTRKELKLKFIREENQHPELVKRTLEATMPLELTPFEIALGEPLSGPQHAVEDSAAAEEVV